MSLEFTYNSLSKAPQGLLLNMAIMLLDNINKEGTYDSKEYGDVKDIKRWRKDKLIKWLLQFEIGVTKTNDESNNKNLDIKENTNKIDNNLKETPEQKSIRELKEANDAAQKAQDELKEALRKAEEASKAAANAQKKFDNTD